MLKKDFAFSTPKKACELLYQERHFALIYKPPGILSQETEIESFSVENWGRESLSLSLKKPVFFHLVHRLDKPVSGLILGALSSKALSRLNSFMREGKFVKEYIALVEKEPPEDRGVIEGYLHKESFSTQVGSEGKKAILHYEKMAPKILKITLDTGRYHQIRALCAHSGFPVAGDVKYGGSPSFALEGGGIYLHSALLSFPHPITQETCQFYLPPPWEIENDSMFLQPA